MRFGPVGRRHVTVDGAAQEWMGETKRSLVQHARPDQQIGGPRRVGGCEPGQPGRLVQLGPLQNGHRPSQARRVGTQPHETQHRPAAQGGGRDVLYFGCRRGDRRDLLLSQSFDQRADQKRRTAGRLPAGRRELRFGLDTQAGRHQRGHPPRGERPHRDHLGRRIHRQGGQQLPTLSGLGRPSPEQHRDMQLLQAGQQEGQKAKRRTVSPMGVIDHQRQGALRRQVGAQPVQPVEHRERRVRGDRRSRSHAVTQARKTQQPCRHPGRPIQQLGPLLLRRSRHHRLDQLAHHPERELALQLRPARSQYPETLSLCRIPGDRQQHGLADPSRPLHHQRSATALPRPLQALPYPLQLSITLEQETVALTHGRDHNPPYVAPVRIARRPTRRPQPAFTSPRTVPKWKVRGGARGFPRVRIRGQRIEHELRVLWLT